MTVVVKLMPNGYMAQREMQTLRLFQARPHANIVRGMCAVNSGTFVVAVQAFVPGGTLADFAMDDVTWRSVTLQLTFACLEWYDSYMNWHSKNVLMDATEESAATYAALGETWRVADLGGVRPVLTDFSRANIVGATPKPWTLASALGILWDMMQHTAPPDVRQRVGEFSIEAGECTSVSALLAVVQAFSTSSSTSANECSAPLKSTGVPSG